MGFEPTRAEHNGLAVHRLNLSAKGGAKRQASRGKERKKEGKRGEREEKKRRKKEETIHYINFYLLSCLLNTV